jgi:hypothetical protein
MIQFGDWGGLTKRLDYLFLDDCVCVCVCVSERERSISQSKIENKGSNFKISSGPSCFVYQSLRDQLPFYETREQL